MGEPCSRCGAVWGGPPGEVCDLCRSLGRLVGCVQEAPVNPSLRHALLVRVRTWTGETQDLIDRCREAEGRALLSSKTGSGLQPPGGLAPYTGPLPPPQGGVAALPKAGGFGGERAGAPPRKEEPRRDKPGFRRASPEETASTSSTIPRKRKEPKTKRRQESYPREEEGKGPAPC